MKIHMDSLEDVHHALGKREAPMADETINSTEAVTNTTKTAHMHHHKKSVSIFSFTIISSQNISFRGYPWVLTLNLSFEHSKRASIQPMTVTPYLSGTLTIDSGFQNLQLYKHFS
jgi:hypothetical protein